MVVLRIALFFGVLALLILPGWWASGSIFQAVATCKNTESTALLFALTLGLYGIGAS